MENVPPPNKNIAVFTLKQVIERKWPILHIVFDKEGEWQFLSDEDVTMDDLVIVKLEDVLSIDPTVAHALHIDRGHEASRENILVPWITMKSIE